MNEIILLQERVKGLKVLFAEDEEDVRKSTAKFLEKIFDNVVVCEDGQKGLEKFLQTKDFDVVISDINMPNMDGLTMISKIKEVKDDTICVIVSALRDRIDANEDLDIMYILKPFTFDSIIHMIKEIDSIVSARK